jgi:hypothetical protein
MNTGFSVGVALHANGLARALASARIRLGALPANGQTTEVANSAIAFDALQTLQVHADLPAQITFYHVFAILNRVNDLGELLFIQALGPNARIDVGLDQNGFCVNRANAVDVTQCDIDTFLARYFNSNDARHI